MTGRHAPAPLEHLDAERWRRIEAVLDQALELPTGEIPAFLDRACAGDAQLRAQVEDLLAADLSAGAFLAGPVAESAPALLQAIAAEEEAWPSPQDRRVGPYRLVSEIGRGGMGAVHLAERADGQFEQRVALKLIKRGLDTDEILDRFKRERQILARLQHPHIARLLDGGVTDDGLPWFAMEYVEGRPLAAWCRERGLGLEDRLRLFKQVCDAVEYAHRGLVVHRDLKPSNILVTADGQVKLLDFGIAKVLDPPAVERPETRTAARLMTPHYAAPEQIRGEPPTTATDVYSLGVVLYELLAGARPYRRKLTSAADMERAVLEEEPEPPSAATTRPSGDAADAPADAAQTPAVSPRAWRDRLRGDLDNIVLMALRKEPERRYPSAEALREDLRGYLDGRPVRATAPTFAYRSGKFLRRNRVVVTAGTLVALSLVAGLVGTTWQARLAKEERDRARLEARKAEEIKDFALSLFRVSNPYEESGGGNPTARELLEGGVERVRTELRGQPEVQAEMYQLLAAVYQDLGDLDRAGELQERGLELRHLVFGREHPQVASSLRSLGVVHMHRAEFAPAESLIRLSLEMSRRLEGERSAEAIRSLGELAVLKNRTGAYAESESLYRLVLRLDEKRYGVDHDEVATDLSNLAVLLDRLERDREAEALLRRALDIRRRALGEDHALTAIVADNLAVCLSSQGRLAEAESLYRAALAIRRKRLGPTHVDVALTLHNLAGLLRQKGDFGAAEKMFLEALEISRAAQGPDHPDVARSTNNLAVLYYFRGDYAAAARHFEETLHIWRKTLGEDHANTLSCLQNLGVVRREQGRFAEAERIFQQVLARCLAQFGEDHAQTAYSYHHLGVLRRLEGEPREAERLLRRALDIRRKAMGAEHRSVANTEEALAGLLRDEGRSQESLALYRDALGICRKAFTETNVQTADVLVGLGRLQVAAGRPAEAESLLREALRVRRRELVSGDVRTAEAEAALGVCLSAQGKVAEAEPLLDAGLPVLERRPGARDPLVDAAAGALARIRAQRARS